MSVGKRAGLESEFTQVKASFCNKPTSRAIKDTALDSSAFDQSSSPVTGPCGSFLSPPCGCCAPHGVIVATPVSPPGGRLFALLASSRSPCLWALGHSHGGHPVGCWKPRGGYHGALPHLRWRIGPAWGFLFCLFFSGHGWDRPGTRNDSWTHGTRHAAGPSCKGSSMVDGIVSAEALLCWKPQLAGSPCTSDP